jgi:hypothetical protein
MGAQISLEIKHTASTKGGGAPAVAIADEVFDRSLALSLSLFFFMHKCLSFPKTSNS